MTMLVEALTKAAEQFNQHEFWESHETLEAVWLTAEPPLKTALQGIIQVAAGCHHIANVNYKGAVSLFTQALEKLHSAGNQTELVNLMDFTGFVEASEQALAEVKNLGPEKLSKFCPGKFPEINLN